MKFITQTLAFIYVGTSTSLYLAHAEKSNVRGLQTSIDALSIETPVDELESYVNTTSSLEKLPASIEGEEEVNYIVDETETHSNRRRRVTKKSKKTPQPLDSNDKRDVISDKSTSGSSHSSKSSSKKRRTKKHARDLGTVTDFKPIAKGAYPPVVETPVLVYEKSSGSGSGPSKGKGKGSSSSSGSYGGRYGYHHDGSSSSSSSSKGKGKGGRYSYREKRGTYKHEKENDEDCW